MKTRERLMLILATLGVVYCTDWAAYLLAATVTSVDTTGVQTLSNKTMDDSNLYGLLSYGGRLRIRDTQAQSANFNVVDHRGHMVTTGSSTDVTGTLPTATGSYYTYDICKVDTGSKHVVISGTANGATIISSGGISAATRTLSLNGDCETLQDIASNKYVGRGDGT